jgi:hypothetical protein
MNSRTLWSVLPLAVAISTPALALDTPAGEEKLIEELIVSSTRIPTAIIDQNSSISVLTSADLQVQAYDTLGEHHSARCDHAPQWRHWHYYNGANSW